MAKPKTLDQLQAEKEQAETQLAQEQHKLERLENRKKYLEKGERTKRTHRLCNLGGTVESLAPEVKDLTRTEMTELMLNQAQGDREILAKQLNISQQQMTYVTHSEAGEGLIFYGNVILPFIDRFPQNTELYRVMTTKPGEVSA